MNETCTACEDDWKKQKRDANGKESFELWDAIIGVVVGTCQHGLVMRCPFVFLIQSGNIISSTCYTFAWLICLQCGYFIIINFILFFPPLWEGKKRTLNCV